MSEGDGGGGGALTAAIRASCAASLAVTDFPGNRGEKWNDVPQPHCGQTQSSTSEVAPHAPGEATWLASWVLPMWSAAGRPG